MGKIVIDETKHPDGVVTFLLCDGPKALWVSQAIPVGNKPTGDWIAFEHPPVKQKGLLRGTPFKLRCKAVEEARRMAQKYANDYRFGKVDVFSQIRV